MLHRWGTEQGGGKETRINYFFKCKTKHLSGETCRNVPSTLQLEAGKSYDKVAEQLCGDEMR